jgi:putative membrane protein
VWRVHSLFWSFAANAIVLVVLCAFPDISIGSASDLLLAALVFGLLNTIAKPLLKLITLPLAVVTLRLIWFAIAALMLKLTAIIVPSFDIHGFLTLLWATLAVWLLNLALDLVPGPWRGTRRDGRALSKRKD